MNGWESIETGRCEGCRIFTPVEDLRRAHDGLVRCTDCVGRMPPRARTPPVADADLWIPARSETLPRSARLVAGAMLLITMAFPLAACLSQT